MVQVSLFKEWTTPVNLCTDIDEKYLFKGLPPRYALHSRVAVVDIFIEWQNPITEDLVLCLSSSMVEKSVYNPHQSIHLLVERSNPLIVVKEKEENRFRRGMNARIQLDSASPPRTFYHCQPTQLSYYNIICPKLDEATFTLKPIISTTEKPFIKQIILKLDILC